MTVMPRSTGKAKVPEADPLALQFEFEHRALKNYKWFGKLLSFLFGGNLFVCIKRNHSMKGKASKVSSSYFRGKKKFYDFYDSYALFHG